MILIQTFGLAVLVLALAALAFLAYVYRWLMTRSVPDLDGRLTVAGLDQPVVIKRDRHGVPHIRAQTEADVFRAQGFVHAQDRLWQMEQSRRIARGTLSELFGEAALTADVYSRTLGFLRCAEEEWKQLWPHERELLSWYSEGVNAYMRQRPGRLAAEFRLLHFEPEPWTPVDSLALAKLMAWSLSMNWEHELLRLLCLQHLGPDKAAQLDNATPLPTPSILDALGETESQGLLLTAERLLAEVAKAKAYMPMAEPGQGSNCWTVAAARSATGNAFLCNDPHLQVAAPCSLYEQHLSGPSVHAAGAMFPGAPGIMFGHNEQVAWGVTNACTDVQDLFVERLDPERADHYARDGQWHPMELHPETFLVKGRETPERRTIRVTGHGPIVSDVIPDAPAEWPLALQWTGQAPGHTFHCLLALLSAENCQEGAQAFAEWNTPSLNLSLADADGQIRYRLVGRHPVRRASLGLLPNPGWDGTGDWQGFAPFDEQPSLQTPARGVIAHANNRIEAGPDASWYGCDYDPGYRAQRIAEQLEAVKFLGLSEMRRLQTDAYSAFAAVLVPELLRHDFATGWEKYALQRLAEWNLRMEADSEGALIFHYICNSLLQEAFGAQLGPAQDAYLGRSFSPLAIVQGLKLTALTRLQHLILHEAASDWYADGTTGRPRGREAFMRAAIQRGVQELRREMGETTRKWYWGRVHQVRFVHLLGSVWILRPLVNRGPFPIGGDGTTPLQTSYPLGSPRGLAQVAPAYRALMEVGNWDAMESVLNTGQSGHPLSRHYDDQMGMWREGEYHVMPFSASAVDQITRYTLHLEPEGANPRP